MATRFNTQCGNGEYHLQFETDNRECYLRMQEMARRCMDRKPLTNADRIRAMTDEELAGWLCNRIDCTFCKSEMQNVDVDLMCVNQVNGVLDWLQQSCEAVQPSDVALTGES